MTPLENAHVGKTPEQNVAGNSVVIEKIDRSKSADKAELTPTKRVVMMKLIDMYAAQKNSSPIQKTLKDAFETGKNSSPGMRERLENSRGGKFLLKCQHASLKAAINKDFLKRYSLNHFMETS
jgi:hypothetical protein